MKNDVQHVEELKTKVSFLGDLCLNGNYIRLFEEGVDPFHQLGRVLSESDLVTANLECLTAGITGSNPLRSVKLHTRENTLNYLSQLNIGLVTLANNHVYDNLQDGFEKTLDFLDNRRIDHIGAWNSSAEKQSSYIFERNGVRILFLNYTHPDTNPNLPEDCPVEVSTYNRDTICDEIREVKDHADHIVLLLHWGGKVEGGLFPAKYQTKDSRAFIKSGADLIIGHHTHTFQPYEIIHNKYVFYSLGDFCSDNVYKGGRRFNFRSESAIAEIDFYKSEYKVFLHPIRHEKLFIKPNPVFGRIINKRNRNFKIIRNFPFYHGYLIYLKIIEPVLYYFFGYNRRFTEKIKGVSWNKLMIFLRRIFK